MPGWPGYGKALLQEGIEHCRCSQCDTGGQAIVPAGFWQRQKEERDCRIDIPLAGGSDDFKRRGQGRGPQRVERACQGAVQRGKSPRHGKGRKHDRDQGSHCQR